MPPLQNTRQELFAQYMAEGNSAAESMRKAGYKSSSDNSKMLTKKHHIQSRIAELQERNAKAIQITVAGQTAKLEKAYAIAERLDRPDAMVGAVREQSVLNGIRIERSEHGAAGEFAALSDKDLAEQLHTRLVTALAVAQQKEATEH